MNDYLNKPATYDSAEVIDQAREEVRRRVANREDASLSEVRESLNAYLLDLEQRNLISGTIHNYLCSALDIELEKARLAYAGVVAKPAGR